jgi:hypothetical protein
MLIVEPSRDASAPPIVWQLMELTNGAQLRTEGMALHHCVASYADQCWRGASRIWSLRVRRGEKVRHVLTIEVDMKRRAVVQARGWGNRAASGNRFGCCRIGRLGRGCGRPSEPLHDRFDVTLPSPARGPRGGSPRHAHRKPTWHKERDGPRSSLYPSTPVGAQ